MLELPHLRRLVSRTSEKLYFWDLGLGAELGSFGRKQGGFFRGICSVMGSHVVSWSHGARQSICLWDAAAISQVGCLDGSAKAILMLSDNRHLLSIRDFGQGMDVWDLHTLRHCGCLGEQTVHTLGVLEVAGAEVLSWHADGTLRLWDVQACTNEHDADPRAECLERIDGTLLTPRGHLVSWGGVVSQWLCIWDCKSGRLASVR